MTQAKVLSKAANGVLHLTINREDKLNALNKAVLQALHEAVHEAGQRPDIRCVVLTGAGTRAFAAGADIAEIQALKQDEVAAFIDFGQQLMNDIENLGKPVIAAIHGYALGGGCELALACTLRIASSGAQLGLPEVGLGLIPGYGGTQRLSRLAGRGRALQMMLTGRPIAAEQALLWGILNDVVEPEQLEATVGSLAEKLAASAPLAMRAILAAVHQGVDLEMAHGLEIEKQHFAQVCNTADMREGTTAFLEKRKPEFKGE